MSAMAGKIEMVVKDMPVNRLRIEIGDHDGIHRLPALKSQANLVDHVMILQALIAKVAIDSNGVLQEIGVTSRAKGHGTSPVMKRFAIIARSVTRKSEIIIEAEKRTSGITEVDVKRNQQTTRTFRKKNKLEFIML